MSENTKRLSRIPRGAVNNITPFTYRDGLTYLQLIEELRKWATRTFPKEIGHIIDELIDELEEANEQYELGIEEFQRIHDAFMADVNASLMALNDDAVADLLDDAESQIRQRVVVKNELVFNVKDYGATGDNVTDDTDAINAALDAATEGSRVWFPPGLYRTTSEIVVSKNNDIDMYGTIVADHDGTALTINQLGLYTTLQCRHRLSVRKKNMNHSEPDSVGIKVYGCYNQFFDIQHVNNFTVGLLLTAPTGLGCVYNLFNLQGIHDNMIGVRLFGMRYGDTDPEMQWVNQNTFIGGRISWSPSTPDHSKAVGLQLGTSSTGQNTGNGNVFLNTSIEDVGLNGVYARPVECFGSWNTFIAIRMEGGLNPTFRPGSQQNRWIGGLYGNLSLYVDEGTQNVIDAPIGGKRWAIPDSKQSFKAVGPNTPAISLSNQTSEGADLVEFMNIDGVTKNGGINGLGRVSFKFVTHYFGYYQTAPTEGTWRRGDVVWHLRPIAGGKIGWVCVEGGTPGEWKAFGSIDD